MKNNHFSAEFLINIRTLLPRGAQKAIVEKLNNSGHKVTIADVHGVLHGDSLKYGKPPYLLIIKTATEIIKETYGADSDQVRSIEREFQTANKQ